MSFMRFINATSSTFPRQCASASVLFATGDTIAQQFVEKKGKNHDLIRTGRLAVYGGVIFAPIMSTWMGKILERVKFQNKAATLGTKVLLDQVIMSPLIISIFFTATNFLEGKPFSAAQEKLKTSWLPTYKAAVGVWAPVQAINFSIVPPHLRLLFVNVVSVGWNTFLSVQAAGGANERKAEAKVDELEAPLINRAKAVGAKLEREGNKLVHKA
ncbi:hypothetical protein IE81DRAFT_213736 [Ceraceosorus guamensis]|uniref:Uncharacterized protein n=1 Tax=Ceraceosorus guamensis TaxID=1522189 RepID=A0A316VSU6_9BASI|nr:hypothetical protein IE81DRAFT_213736 [Ceraceosorus guamensis]PWN40657.1 hypothetical protein IE81DRAFT_213736 [Ceraceosorus guamensis]